MIRSLKNRNAYRKRSRLCWSKNSTYWLSNPLRHVVDVGDYIADTVIRICSRSRSSKPTIVDMGFGSAWLYQALSRKGFSCYYIGFDSNEDFINYSLQQFATDKSCRFDLVDLEEPIDVNIRADLVVSAFSLFELSDLRQPMTNAFNLLLPNGHFLISTIDPTYLILAVSDSWPEFLENLARYETLPGTKYAFQPIDLGDKASNTLEYPSVLYSRYDYLSISRNVGFHFGSYKEHILTAKPIPKIYFHLELVKGANHASST